VISLPDKDLRLPVHRCKITGVPIENLLLHSIRFFKLVLITQDQGLA
jgi:hypothetical protein